MNRSWRAATLTIGALAGAVAFVRPAAADVTVTPSAAIRGGPARVEFHVPEERPGAYTTKVELVAPEATPIAEIYPMSVDDWAPTITTRKLDQPVELIHGTTTTEVPASITWVRFGDAPSTPVQPAALAVSLGPMPQADRVAFTVVQTYSDGTVVRWSDSPDTGGSQAQHPAPVVTLIDPEPVADSGNSADGSGTGGNGPNGVRWSALLLGLVAALGIEGWTILRAVRGHLRPAAAVGSEGNHR
ncbi:YcnI family protein [Planosporangium flavigriseum]|uniref:YncI copper-binding domain-containing protein n=1 Tax=Planosporangium flavigriseum TaxID=373681 RepID=A0A8J3PQ82_9ACTN|nr:YcnI family protein [Planosporangium flavigriseum]NJC67931.1 YcnI family protein [Planosporangium flavigriseum]GIG76683.1 hypothetical protein Pfl04_50870 [Planosporangium flavigriseum]